MRVLIIGGTGLISRGIVKHLLERQAQIVCFNRGQRENTLPEAIQQIHGDRNDSTALQALGKFDVVIDMVCFNPQQAAGVIEAFAGKCGHFIFCSTVCTYGVKVPPGVFVDENFPQEPISAYGRNKLACEKLFLEAHSAGRLNATIIRPSCTYGPGGSLIDNLEFNPAAWDRIAKGLPVLCAGDGLGLWVATHRDDVGKLFAHAALNPKTFGECYNATRDHHDTWRDLYRQTAQAIGGKARLLFMPASWIIRHDEQRFGLLKEITQYHGAYNSQKARRDVPQFRCDMDYVEGAKQTLSDMKRRNAYRFSEDDALYQKMVESAQQLGIEPVEA